MQLSQSNDLWMRLRQAQVLTKCMAQPCSTTTHDEAALNALGELDALACLLGELLAQALQVLEEGATPA